MTETHKLRVFLCHASQDKPVVRELYQRLLAEEWIDPWLDEEKLLPGQDWDMEVEKAVEQADVVFVFLSKNSTTKEGYIQKELKFVLSVALEKLEGAIFTIPIRLDDCAVPRRLRLVQYIDYFPLEQKQFSVKKILFSLDKKFVDIFGYSRIKKDQKDLRHVSIKHQREQVIKNRHETGLAIPTKISGLSGGTLGLISFFLPWVFASCSGGESYSNYTGYEISMNSYYFGPYSPVLLLFPIIAFMVLAFFVFYDLFKKYIRQSGTFLFDCGATMVVTLLAHIPWVSKLIKEDGYLIHPAVGLFWAVISTLLIIFSGVYEIFVDISVNRFSRFLFIKRRIFTFGVFLIVSSILIYKAEDIVLYISSK